MMVVSKKMQKFTANQIKEIIDIIKEQDPYIIYEEPSDYFNIKFHKAKFETF